MTLSGNFGDPRTERDIRSAKRMNFIALVVLVLLAGLLLYLFLHISEQHRQLEEKTQQLTDTTAFLRHLRGELETTQVQLAAREKQVEDLLRNLSRDVQSGNYEGARRQVSAIQSAKVIDDKTERVIVHLYSYHPKDDVVHAIQQYLEAGHYQLMRQEVLTSEPPSTMDRSMVFYYSPDAHGTALRLASELSRVTGISFETSAGNPSDVPAETHQEWLRVLYLGTPEYQKQ